MRDSSNSARAGGRSAVGTGAAPHVTGGRQQSAGRTPLPWAWLLPGVAVLVGLTAWGAVVYPDLPPDVPQQFGPDGVDSYAAKSIGSVFAPVIVYAATLALMTGVAVALLRVRPEAEIQPGERLSSLVNRPATREGAARMARATLLLTFCIGLTIAGACALMWQTGTWQDPAGWAIVPVLAPVALGTAALLLVALRDRLSAAGRS